MPDTLLSLWFSWLFRNYWWVEKPVFLLLKLFVFEYSWSFDLLSGSMDRSAFFPANLQNKSEGLVKSIQPIISTLLTHHHISWLSSLLIIITKACLFSFYIEHVIRNAVTTDLRNPLGNLCVLSYGLRSEDVIEWTIEGISLFPPWHLWRKRLGNVPVIFRFVVNPEYRWYVINN